MLTTVSSSEALVAALKVAHAGDTIQLATGVYAPVSLTGLHFSSDVTITSQNPGAPAVLTGFTIRDSDHLKLTNLELKVDPLKADNPFQVLTSTAIKLDHLDVHGSLNGNAQDDQSAMLIRGSSNISVTNSEFHQLQNGIAYVDSDHIAITGNYFHEIRTDGVHGGGTSNITISKNYFTNFTPAAGDHGDAIQFWTAATTASAHDIVVSDNVIMRGAGGLIQGIFFRDQVGDLPFQNVQVTGNLVVGAMYGGIAVGGANNVTVSNNMVAGLADQKSWLALVNVTNATLTNNQATSFVFERTTNVTETNDTTIPTATDGGKLLLQSWMTAHSGSLSTMPDEIGTDGAALKTVQAIEFVRAQLVTKLGTDAAEKLSVDSVHDSILKGGAGDDTLSGGGTGHNTLSGGTGDDIYYVRSETEVVVEGANEGNDLVCSTVDFVMPDNVEQLRLSGSGNYALGNSLANKITGSTGDDQIFGNGGNDNLNGVDGNDWISGGDGNDGISGQIGNDTLIGDAGADALNGDEGNDSLSGGAGADTLNGGTGVDRLSGGAGADTFIFRTGQTGVGGSADVITDFVSADGDKISLYYMDANTLKTGDQGFTFIGAQSFHKIAGELRYEYSGGVGHVMGDTNGDGVADFQIDVIGVGTFKAADFLL